MRHYRHPALLLLAGPALVGLSLAACARREPAAVASSGLKVTDVQVGRSLAPDKTIAEKTDSFLPSDTFYVSVRTEGGAQGATLQARWTYRDGQLVHESSQTIAPTGEAVTEFHASKPDGWPAGEYKVEVMLNGVPAGSKSFEVE